MDILLEQVSYGDGPVEIDRSGSYTTFQFKCVAVYDPLKQPNNGVGRVRLYNKKNNTYFPALPTGTVNDLVRNRP